MLFYGDSGHEAQKPLKMGKDLDKPGFIYPLKSLIKNQSKAPTVRNREDDDCQRHRQPAGQEVVVDQLPIARWGAGAGPTQPVERTFRASVLTYELH